MARITRLTLTNYRNFHEVDLAPPEGVCVFFGANAQGKTALLEAAYTLAIGRSFRADSERQVVNFDAARNGNAAYITGMACRDGQTLTVVVGYLPSARVGGDLDRDGNEPAAGETLPPVTKQVRVNRQPATASGLVGRIAATLFSVDDLDIVLGSPSHRRRYLDVLICQSDRDYLDALQRYQAALRNRNRLLRRQRDGQVDPEEMQYWDGQLVGSGALVTNARAETVLQLDAMAREQHRELAEGAQDLRLEYRASTPPCGSAADAEDEFRERLRRNTAREKATGTTAVGPHRDDFAIYISGLDAGSFASRGEARTIALALRLAEAQHLARLREEDPLILLDDVFSEMDDARTKRILQKASEYRQAFLTTTHPEAVREALGGTATYYRVDGGNITLHEAIGG